VKNVSINSLVGVGKDEPELTASPTNRLMLAVLEEAVATFKRGMTSCCAEQRYDSCKADRWIASKNDDLLFSFENICTSLRIDPSYVRAGLKRLKGDALRGKEIDARALRRERMYDRRAWRGRIGKRSPNRLDRANGSAISRAA
jgi:hypothetical protein